MSSTISPVIIVHGGAREIAEYEITSFYPGIQEAVRVGYRALMTGSALDAVERAITSLEDNPRFNAGYGSKLNAAGGLEMDAIIMDGSSLKSGAVACVEDFKNPVHLARCVMEKTEHDLLIGKGLAAFMDEMGLARTPGAELVADWSRQQLTLMQESEFLSEAEREKRRKTEHDTVGAVALDHGGNIACGTSTGGITGQRVGRVGDSPLIGCGAYCDSAVGGVTTTGLGEGIMRIAMASRIIIDMEHGLTSKDAATKSLDMLKQRTGYTAGAIIVSADGQAHPAFSTSTMSWATARENRVTYGVRKNEIRDGGIISDLT